MNQRKEVSLYRQVLDGKKRLDVSDSFDGKPLSLEESLILANQRNEQLGISGETYVQALIAKQRAFAAFLPTITFAPTFTYLSHPSSVINSTGGSHFIQDVPVAATGNAFNGFRDAATLEMPATPPSSASAVAGHAANHFP